jgi:hypothetical protein
VQCEDQDSSRREFQFAARIGSERSECAFMLLLALLVKKVLKYGKELLE